MGVRARPYRRGAGAVTTAGLTTALAVFGLLQPCHAAVPAAGARGPLAAGGPRATPAPAALAVPDRWVPDLTGGFLVDDGAAGTAPVVDRIELGGLHFDSVSPGDPATRTLTVRYPVTRQFGAVGVSWTAGRRTGEIGISVRAHTPRGDWSPWRDTGPCGEHRPAARSGRTGADLVWFGSGDGVELRITVSGGAVPTGLAVDLIDPVGTLADATAGLDGAARADQRTVRSSAGVPVPMPSVVRRAAWGADERLRTWQPEYTAAATGVALRGLALGTDYAQSDVPRILRAVYWYQAVALGWGDIGYQVVVDRFGRLWEGRVGGLARSVTAATPLTGAVPPAAARSGAARRPVVLAVLGGAGQPPATVADAVASYAAWRLSLGPAVDPRTAVFALDPVRRATAADPVAWSTAADLVPGVAVRTTALLGSVTGQPTQDRRVAVWRPADLTWRRPGVTEPVLTGQPGDIPVPADYDGDGTVDAAVWTPSTGTWRISGSSGGTTGEIRLGAAGDRPVPADFDGDGRAEPATWTPTNGTWNFAGAGGTTWGQAGDVPLPADYDGDGRAEPGVWRPSRGRWYLLGVGVLRLGSPWHLPVPADYDGDGAVEPASWSPRSHRWYLSGRRPVRFGGVGDQPAAGRYDGDSRADLAVLHAGGTGPVWRVRGLGEYPIGDPGDVPAPLI